MATQYGVNQVVQDERLGEVKVLEAFDATENSPEQYIVLTEGGEVVRTAVLGAAGEAPAAAEAPMPQAPAAEADLPPASQDNQQTS